MGINLSNTVSQGIQQQAGAAPTPRPVGSGISLAKGQKVDLTKGNAGLKKIRVGLGWDINGYDGQQGFDLDASVFLLNANGKVSNESDFVFYNNTTSRNNAVVHKGDNKTGEGAGDDEVIEVTFANIPTDVEKISIAVTIHEAEERHQNFGQVSNAYVHVVDADTNQELLRYDLGEDYSVETGLTVCEIYKHNGEWKFNAVGSGFRDGLASLCRIFGLNI